MHTCTNCGSEDTEVYVAEGPDEPTVIHCHTCGTDERTDR